MLNQEFCPERTVIDPHEKVVFGQTESLVQGDGQSNQFRIRRWRVIPDNVAIDLIELPQSSFLRFFKTEKWGNAEPFDRLPVFPPAGRNQTGQSRGHFRPQADVSISLVDETEQLRFQLLATFSFVEFSW